MLEKQLTDKIALMKKVQVKQKRVNNINTQKVLDQKFSDKTRKTENLIDSIYIVNSNLHIAYNVEILNESVQSFNTLITHLNDQSVQQLDIDSLDTQYSKLEKICKDNWKNYYSSTIENTINLLGIVNSINPIEFTSISNELKANKNWISDPVKMNNLVNQINKANNDIESLKLDDDIKLFLNKINKNSASLLDLNEKIINWIKEENLEGKIKLRIGS